MYDPIVRYTAQARLVALLEIIWDHMQTLAELRRALSALLDDEPEAGAPRLAGWRAEVCALTRRIEDLEAELRGVETSAEELAAARAHRDALGALAFETWAGATGVFPVATA